MIRLCGGPSRSHGPYRKRFGTDFGSSLDDLGSFHPGSCGTHSSCRLSSPHGRAVAPASLGRNRIERTKRCSQPAVSAGTGRLVWKFGRARQTNAIVDVLRPRQSRLRCGCLLKARSCQAEACRNNELPLLLAELISLTTSYPSNAGAAAARQPQDSRVQRSRPYSRSWGHTDRQAVASRELFVCGGSQSPALGDHRQTPSTTRQSAVFERTSRPGSI